METKRFWLKMLVLVLVFGIMVIGCGDDENSTNDKNSTNGGSPTVILTPTAVTVNDGNLIQTVNVAGTATGTVTLDAKDLPARVIAAVSGTTVTITGVRPTTDVPAITGTFYVQVTRENITENILVTVNLTTTWIPQISFDGTWANGTDRLVINGTNYTFRQWFSAPLMGGTLVDVSKGTFVANLSATSGAFAINQTHVVFNGLLVPYTQTETGVFSLVGENTLVFSAFSNFSINGIWTK